MFNFCSKCVVNSLKNNKNLLTQRLYSAKALRKEIRDVRPLISCRRKEFDFYPNQQTNKFENVSYASKGWHHKKSKGDYFIIHMSEGMDIFEKTTFEETELNTKIVDALRKRNILHPSNIQFKSIPSILSGQNTLLAAETGCGKTLAYLLPALHLIINQKRLENQENVFNSPFCLVLTPSRELATQVYEVAKDLTKDLGLKSNVVIGGGMKRKIFNPNLSEVDLLIATPGAVSKLLSTGVYKTQLIQHVILDEADTLLDESFSQRISFILKRFPFSFLKKGVTGVQLTLASATMPIQLPDIISDIIIPESLARITTENLHKVLFHVPQRFLRIGSSMKPAQLIQLVKNDVSKNYPVMIFSNDTKTCDWISMFLNENGAECVNLNGDMNLFIRKDVFKKFQSGAVNVISCTDVGSRGLDTTRVSIRPLSLN